MPDFVETFFNNYGATSLGAADASFANKVYLGTQKVKSEKVVSPTGVEYTSAPSKKDVTETIAQAKARYLVDATLQTKWVNTLRKNGFDADPIQARALWDLSVDGASDWYATSNGQQKVTPEQYLGWYASGKTKGKGEGNLPTRQIYEVRKEDIEADINDIAMRTLGRTIVDTDKNSEWYKNLVNGVSELYSKGTVTSTKQTVNPKTGKKENVVVQSPKFSKEQITQKITSAVETADPETLARKKNLDFAEWAFKKMGGQG